MRRTALLGPLFALTLALPACAGMDDFLANTFSLEGNPNKPIGDSLTMRRVQGLSASAEPVSPQPGNVWPRGVDRMPTLQDIEPERAPAPRSSGNPRTGALPAFSPATLAATPPAQEPAQPALPTATGSIVLQPDRYQTVSTPTGTDVLVPNGNGTATLMRADGTMEIVPTPR